MEEVLEKMETALVSLEPKVDKTSSFEGLYKNWGKNDNQEERRKELLEIQRGNRNTKLDTYRGILDLVNAAKEKDIFHSNKKVSYRPSIYVSGFNKAPTSYNNILMMSEWMVEKPSDIAENWYITPCPKGTRMLVIASEGRTKCYTKYGSYKFTTCSALPGGDSGGSQNSKDKYCILDCFYQDSNNTMYVLDLLAWSNQAMTECEAEFRNYWLKSKFSESPELGVVSKKNKIRFLLLPKVPCKPDELNNFMMTYPHFENNTPALDGLLFYHKQAHYVSGETPLVGWLFPYMVPEVLGADIPVHVNYVLQKPNGYVNQAGFIQKFEEKQSKKKNRGRRSSAMDTADVIKNENEMEAQDSASQGSLDVKPAAMEAEESSDATIDKKEIENSNAKVHVGSGSEANAMEAKGSSETTIEIENSNEKVHVGSGSEANVMEAEESSEATIDKKEIENSNEKVHVGSRSEANAMEAKESSETTIDKKEIENSNEKGHVGSGSEANAMEAEDSSEAAIDKKEIENSNEKVHVVSGSEAKT